MTTPASRVTDDEIEAARLVIGPRISRKNMRAALSAAAEVRSLSSDSVSDGSKGVRVKPLEWKENLGRGGGYVYEISQPNRTPGWRVWVRPNMGMQQVIGGGIITVKAKDRDEAIAVAEADYHFRILSALDSGTGGQQPVAWRWRVIGDSRWTVLDHEPEISDGFRDRCEVQALYLSPTEPKAGVATHRHKKRGSEYALIGIGKMQTERWRSHPFGQDTTSSFDAPVDMREVAIYRSVDDGSLWVRPREEFEDGRFAALNGEKP